MDQNDYYCKDAKVKLYSQYPIYCRNKFFPLLNYLFIPATIDNEKVLPCPGNPSCIS